MRAALPHTALQSAVYLAARTRSATLADPRSSPSICLSVVRARDFPAVGCWLCLRCSSPCGQSIPDRFAPTLSGRVCLPAALCSAGITPLLSSYGGSDSCRAGSSGTFCYHELPSCPGRSPVFTRALFPRRTITNHPGRHLPLIRVDLRGLRCSRSADFASSSQARRGCRSRIVFTCHYGPSGRFRCSPPRLAATQLLQLLGGTTATTGPGLSPEKSAPLDGARAWDCIPSSGRCDGLATARQRPSSPTSPRLRRTRNWVANPVSQLGAWDGIPSSGRRDGLATAQQRPSSPTSPRLRRTRNWDAIPVSQLGAWDCIPSSGRRTLPDPNR